MRDTLRGMRACEVTDCPTPHYAKGLCRAHYEQQRRGTVLTLERGQYSDEKGTCAAPDCDAVFPQRARGARRLYCSRKCRDRVGKRNMRAAGWTPPHKRSGRDVCAVDGCDKPRYTHGLCSMHYERTRKHGDPGEAGMRRAAAGAGEWRTDANGYVRRSVNGELQLQHRLVMEQHLGRSLWADETVHHRNGDRSDNRLENLELWSSWQPSGQRVKDKVRWARELLARYDNM